jgi:hypothetical protein
MHIEHALAIAYGSLVSTGALVADTIQVDPTTIIGGGGVGVLGWLASTVWRYMKGQEELQKASMKLIEAKMMDLSENREHRQSERSHWNMVETHQVLADTKLGNIHDELRAQRPVTGPHTPVQPATDAPTRRPKPEDDSGPLPEAAGPGLYHQGAKPPVRTAR